jgi:ribosome-binding factor A
MELKLRVTPDLHFTYDEAIDRGERIEQLIRQVHEEDREARTSDPARAGVEDRSKGGSE